MTKSKFSLNKTHTSNNSRRVQSYVSQKELRHVFSDPDHYSLLIIAHET